MLRVPGCPVRGLRLDGGEHDRVIGAYRLRLVVAEMIHWFGLPIVLLCLAFDLAFRPSTPAELAWRGEGSAGGRGLPHR